MCWKQEWAAAIGNIETALKHISAAEAKLERRRQKNFDSWHFQKGQGQDKFEERKIFNRIVKNSEGIRDCDDVRFMLEVLQDRLYWMTRKYGISVARENKRLKKLMAGYHPKRV